jgi:ABC-type sugar transport system ATPase subunit
MAEYVLEVQGLTVRYGEVVALQDVALSLRPGEIHAVLGENGAGKTTLLRALSGMLNRGVATGSVRLDGQPLIIANPRDAINAGVGVVPRRPGLFAGLSISDNVVIGAWQQERSLIINKGKIREQAQRGLDAVGLKLDPDEKATNLTPIQQRLLMIARSCIQPLKVLVLDEPAAMLSNAQELSQLFTVVRGLAGRGIATLYLSRRPTEVLQIADRITVLRDGCAVTEQARAGFDEAELVRMMISQRIGDGGYIDHDDLNEQKQGWLDGLRNLFSGNRR